MLNKVILIGRLTRDPQMRYTSGGQAVTNFSLAVERPYANQAGEREVDFIDIVTWRKLAENCADYLVKGLLVAVDGRLQVRQYELQSGEYQGQRRTVYEVVADTVKFLEWRDTGKAARSQTKEDDFDPEIDVPF